MNLESKIGQLFFVGFEAITPSLDLERYLAELRPGGVVLFSRNVVDVDQLRTLNAGLSRSVDPPPFIAVDQEGGRVSRLRPVLPPLPAPSEIALWGEEKIRAYAAALGSALAALHFNADFAPVVDLSAPGAPNGIGDRSFGEDAALVVRCARAFIMGLAAASIASFLKHFPGLGSTSVDSHVSLPVCSRDGAALWERDLLPFRACGKQAAGVMVAHAHYPAFDPQRMIAASLSEAVVTELLRRRIGFDGVALTDDLEMGAIQGPEPADLAIQALRAGNDMVMFCNHEDRALAARRGVLEAVRAGRLDETLVDRSVARILAAKFRVGIFGRRERSDRPAAPEDFEAALAALEPFSRS